MITEGKTPSVRMDTLILEDLIDRAGFAAVLEMIADICSEKEDHIISSRQDMRTAQVWKRRAYATRRVAEARHLQD